MRRRDFLKLAGAVAATGGCAGARQVPKGGSALEPVDEFLAAGARVMWCAPHPDDECFPGGLLARASIYWRNPLHLLVLTRGEGGECGLRGGCAPDLGAVRAEEMKRAAEIYRASLEHERFFNAPLPVESFPPRPEIYRRWLQYRDPVRVIAASLRRFRPQLLLTFHPQWGATGHPEHQLAARCALAAVRLAAQDSEHIDALPAHRVERVYFVVNRAWLFVLFGRADPGPVSEVFDAALPAGGGLNCVDFMCRATLAHRTQYRDMNQVRSHRWAFRRLSLRLVDPWTEDSPPDAVPR